MTAPAGSFFASSKLLTTTTSAVRPSGAVATLLPRAVSTIFCVVPGVWPGHAVRAAGLLAAHPVRDGGFLKLHVGTEGAHFGGNVVDGGLGLGRSGDARADVVGEMAQLVQGIGVGESGVAEQGHGGELIGGPRTGAGRHHAGDAILNGGSGWRSLSWGSLGKDGLGKDAKGGDEKDSLADRHRGKLSRVRPKTVRNLRFAVLRGLANSLQNRPRHAQRPGDDVSPGLDSRAESCDQRLSAR